MWLLPMRITRDGSTGLHREILCMFSGSRYLFLLTAAELVSDTRPAATALMCLIYPE